jgi:hypothetical protein
MGGNLSDGGSGRLVPGEQGIEKGSANWTPEAGTWIPTGAGVVLTSLPLAVVVALAYVAEGDGADSRLIN